MCGASSSMGQCRHMHHACGHLPAAAYELACTMVFIAQVVHGVDTACYGQGVSKTVDDLLEEASACCAPCSGSLHAQADAATHCQIADLQL